MTVPQFYLPHLADNWQDTDLTTNPNTFPCIQTTRAQYKVGGSGENSTGGISCASTLGGWRGRRQIFLCMPVVTVVARPPGQFCCTTMVVLRLVASPVVLGACDWCFHGRLSVVEATPSTWVLGALGHASTGSLHTRHWLRLGPRQASANPCPSMSLSLAWVCPLWLHTGMKALGSPGSWVCWVACWSGSLPAPS